MDMVIRVMSEVKTREDEYDLVKSIAAHVQGLPSSIQLARRERRLLAHGLLQRVELDDIEGESSYFHSSIQPPGFSYPRLRERKDKPKRSSRLLDAINEWNGHRGRSGSVKSTASSATGVSFKSHTTDSSLSIAFPITPPSGRFPSRCSVVSPSPTSTLDGIYGRPLSVSSEYSGHGGKRFFSAPVSQANNTAMVHAFVFTDITLFATPITLNDEDPDWYLLEDIGLSRILGVKETPKTPSECRLTHIWRK